MSTNICSVCEIDTELVIDHKARNILCSRCGLAFETKLFDEIPLLRNSSQDAVENGVEIENPDCEIENSLTPTSSSNSNDPKIVKNSSKKGLPLIEAMSSGLGLTNEIRDRARDIYNEVDILRTCRGRSMSLIIAACVYIACKETGFSRTLNEISAVDEGLSKKLINRTAEAIKKQLESESWTLQPEGLVQRYCMKLGLGKRAIKAVQEAVIRAQELDIRRSPKSILSAIIFMVIQLCRCDGTPPSLIIKDIAIALEVTELTIKKSFNDVSVHAPRLIPNWYASEEDIEKIANP